MLGGAFPQQTDPSPHATPSGALAVPRGGIANNSTIPRNFSVEFFPDSYDGGGASGLLATAQIEGEFSPSGDAAAVLHHQDQLRVLRVQKIQEEFRLSRLYTDMLFLCRAGNVKTLQAFCKAKGVAVSDPAVCDYDKRTALHLALDFETGRAYGHSEMTCFGDRLAEETLHVCDMLYVSNIDSYVDDRGAGDN